MIRKFAMYRSSIAHVPLMLTFLSVPLFLSACGGSSGGEGRHLIEGSVLHEGRPVVSGKITFTPNTAQGNSGPGSVAFIDGGRYRTSPDHGVVGGPHIVDILAYDGISQSEHDLPEDEGNEPEALQFRLNVDLPPSGGTYDFELPPESDGA